VATVLQPSGTVTLVVTDIEGSMKLLDSLGPEEFRHALEPEVREPGLQPALELLDAQTTSIASPNE